MDESEDEVRSILHALAALSPNAADASEPSAIPLEWFRWLEMRAVGAFLAEPGVTPPPTIDIDADYAERVAALSQVRGGSIARLGWLFLAGSVRENGTVTRIFQPLVYAPVRVWRQPITGSAYVGRVGDAMLSLLIGDVHSRHELERRIEYGGGAFSGASPEVSLAFLRRLPRLQAFVRDAARAAGFPDARLVPVDAGPDELMRRDEVSIVAGVGLYCREEDKADLTRAGSLRRWASEDLDTPTALHALYSDAISSVDVAHDPVASPLRLTPTQAAAVKASRANRITVLQGAPGTGKSHTIAAIALDQMQREASVLIVAKSDSTVDALIDLLEQCPGPSPVVFGSNERREALADRLSTGRLSPVSSDVLVRAEVDMRRLETQVQSLTSRIVHLLEVEQGIQEGRVLDVNDLSLYAATDRAAELRNLVQEAESAHGFFQRRHARRALERLRTLLSADECSDAEVVAVARAEIDSVAARELIAAGGLGLTDLWQELAAVSVKAREARARYLSFFFREAWRLDRARGAISALAVALRSGRAARREQLRRIRPTEITSALPLWMGTLADVDDLLPLQPGFFDLVILDEAASVDQPLAASALLRGKRAVVAGDPRQLRQVSFLSDAEMATAMDASGIYDPILRSRLDVRRNSALDVAIGVVEPIVLDEHFRSEPHLIDFVAKRLYGGRVKVATRRPSTQSYDCVEVVRCEGERDESHVVRSEVDTVMAILRRERTGASSIGIITPFRAQAEALETAVLQAYSADELEAMDLRVGTAHGFQGNERDLMIVSFGVGQTKGAWAFAEDPSLAAVLLTRARRRMIVVTAGDPPERGLLAGFLAQVDSPPGPPVAAGKPSDWVREIAEGAQLAGLSLLTSYPTGRHTVDLVVDDERRDIAIEADIHPTGIDSHIRRRLEMMDRGWSFVEAFRSKWMSREAELVVELSRLTRDWQP